MHARQIAAQTLSVSGHIPHIISIQSPNPDMHFGHPGQKPNVVKTVVNEQDYSGMRN